MSVLLMSALNWLGYSTAGVTALAIATWLLLRLCRVRSPAIQQFAWLVVLLPGVVVWRMSVVLPVLPAGQFAGVDPRPQSDVGRGLSDVGARGRSPGGPNIKPIFSGASGRTIGLWVCAALLGGWVAGMIMLAMRWSLSYMAFIRGLPQPLSPTDAWVAELQYVCEELCVSQPIDLHVTERLGPALCLTPSGYRLLVPQVVWGRFSTQQRRSILRHELAHYVRGDLWQLFFARLLAWPQWFNPLAWLAVRQFEEAAECACDDAVVSADPADAFEYLRALLELGKTDFSASSLQAAASGGSLQRRVRRLLSPTAQDSVSKKLMVVAAALSLAASGFAQIRLASARSPALKNEPVKLVSVRPPIVSFIANGGFEKPQKESDDPESWFGTRVAWTKGSFLLAVSPSVAHTGQRSVVVEIGDRHPVLPVHYNWTTDAKGCQAGKTYELSGWIRVENVQRPAFIMAQCLSKDKARIGGATTQLDYPITGTTDWIRVTTRLKVPEGTGIVRVRAGLSSQDNPGAKAWFDNLSLVAVDK